MTTGEQTSRHDAHSLMPTLMRDVPPTPSMQLYLREAAREIDTVRRQFRYGARRAGARRFAYVTVRLVLGCVPYW